MTRIYDEVDETYVNGWEIDGRFTFTGHKGLALEWIDDDSARRAIDEAYPHREDSFRLILVTTPPTPVEKAVADLLKMSEEDRKQVFGEFCKWCGTEGVDCNCTRDD